MAGKFSTEKPNPSGDSWGVSPWVRRKVKPENHLRGAPGQPSEAGDDGVFCGGWSTYTHHFPMGMMK